MASAALYFDLPRLGFNLYKEVESRFCHDRNHDIMKTIQTGGEDPISIKAEIASDPRLRQMIQDSRNDYKSGNVLSTEQLLKSISPADFKK